MQMNRRKNVIYLIVDSLRPDRTGFGGYPLGTSCFLDRLFESGLTWTNAFTTGCPTEFAYPALTASSLPLDCGGYAKGISEREVSLARVMQKEGYSTVAFFQDYFKSSSSYGSGYDEILTLFGPERFFADFEDTVPFYVDSCREKRLEQRVALARIKDYLDEWFRDFLDYSVLMKKREGMDDVVLTQALKEEIRSYTADKDEFCLSFFEGQARGLERIRRLLKRSMPSDFRRRTLLKAMRLMVPSLITSGSSSPAFKSALKRFLIGSPASRFPSAGTVVQSLLKWIDQFGGQKPFFAWVHTVDIHEQNFVSYDIRDKKMQQGEDESARELLERISCQKRNYFGNPIYDMAVQYTDMQLKRLSEGLRSRGLSNDTLIVLVADHGHPLGGKPFRRGVHVARDFFDELYRVPVCFAGEGIPSKRIDGLCSSLDVAPTLLSLLNLSIPESFKGSALGPSGIGRPFVQMEHAGPGPCDLNLKRTRIAIRDVERKVVYEASPGSRKGRVREAYDLRADPEEKNNLAGRSGLFQALEVLAEKRLEEIRDQAEMRAKGGIR